ncbi:MAG: hypothetical protein IPL78_11340 [Chloroflexi bacterium]|nr:hypothetical protein [Chloroflexota bacterium]
MNVLISDPTLKPYSDVGVCFLGGTILAGILAVGLSYLVPPTYEAHTLVLIVDPSQLVQFDPRFETVEIRPRQAYPVLAVSDSLLQTLLQNVASEVDEPDTLKELRSMIAISASSDPSLLELRVEHSNPASVALIANRWAELFISQANRVIGDQSEEQVAFYVGQRDLAQLALDEAEQMLAEFQTGNRQTIVKAQLESHESALATYLAQQQDLVLLQQDIITLRTQLTGQNGPLLPVDQLAYMLIYERIFGAGDTGPTIELQIQISVEPTADRQQIVTSLDTLQTALTTRSDNLMAQISQLEPMILAGQYEVEVLTADEERLRQAVMLASETYTALVRKVAEEQITSQDTSRGLRQASPAIIPQEPVAPQKMLNGLLAAMVALVSLMAVVLFRHWQQS